ncbi:hypothetical protein F2Q70_00027923 [Brassica cretica]|uniref:Uncharacterized protein n=1 Tax=Brassica cretica TaxID=69181 RepID=A0A8S9LEJ6_BRACR|nr:hypothetical protein F2Q70_00027923 [Brassica cretica]
MMGEFVFPCAFLREVLNLIIHASTGPGFDHLAVFSYSLQHIELALKSETTDEGLRQSSDDPSKGSEGQTPPGESRTPPRSVTP